MDKNRIICAKAEDREALCLILARNGYTVRMGREKTAGTKNFVYYIEYWK